MSKFYDGLKSFMSSLTNQRRADVTNGIEARKLTDVEMRHIYRTGLGNKIVRLKAGYALRDTLQFDSAEDELFYKTRLAKVVKQAVKWQIAFGRGIIVLHKRGDDLRRQLGTIDDPKRLMFSVFSGDMTTTNTVDRDLQSPRYYLPVQYNVRGETIHHSRVIDFRYVLPPELDAPDYRYGGISEFELIYDQLIADGVVQRASPQIIDKASTLFYKVKGFKEAISTGSEADMVSYFSRMESLRGIFAAGLIDADDEVVPIDQTISNLADADQITLRRLAMVTGIPLALLVGENVKGLNSTGENERQAFQDMIEVMQEDYLLDPINELMRRCGKGPAAFKENQGETPETRITYDTKAIDNALKLWQMGEDYQKYLEDKGVVTPDDWDKVFGSDDPDGGEVEPPDPNMLAELLGGGNGQT